MKTISIISHKGGAGKSTLSINLAVAATKARLKSVLVDADPQESVYAWSSVRDAEHPAIIQLPEDRTLSDVQDLAEDLGAKITFIDTEPRSSEAAREAARIADLVIMPVKPSNLDLKAIGTTVDIIKREKCAAFFVLNDCKPNHPLTREAREALKVYGIPVAPVAVVSRVAFISSLIMGQGVLEYEPKGKAALEVRALWKAVKQSVGQVT